MNHAKISILTWMLSLLASSAAAQSEVFAPSPPGDGSLWAQSLAPKASAGSAQLAYLDLGPGFGQPVSGQQAIWLEWTPEKTWVGLLGGGASSVEVTAPGGTALSGCLGAATFRGGFVNTYVGGVITGVEGAVGCFVWTGTKLYAVAVGGGVATAEVAAPGGGSITGVLGISILDSFIIETSTFPPVSDPKIHASALVYTAAKVYHVSATLLGGISSTATEVLAPGGGSIASTRGATALVGGMDSSASPPVDSLGAVLLWNPGHVYLITKSPALSVSEVTAPGGGALAGCWGIMRLGAGSLVPIRASAQIWQSGHAWIAAIEPGITVLEATQAPGSSGSAPIASNVFVAGAGGSPLILRQAGLLSELMGTMLVGGSTGRALIVGQNQREQ